MWKIVSISILFLILCVNSVSAETYKPEINGEQIQINDFGGTLTLENNEEATDPTYEELIDFIKEDKTDYVPYIDGVVQCGWFAQTVHDNAEKAGISAGVVVLMPEKRMLGHSFVVFDTTDKGLVYVDCMSLDGIATLKDGYKVVCIDNPEFTWEINGLGYYTCYYFW